LNFSDITAAQATDPTAQNYAAPMQGLAYQDYHGIQLLCHQSTNQQWKIVIPEALINDTICWYHAIMGHIGSSRLYDSLRSLVCRSLECDDVLMHPSTRVMRANATKTKVTVRGGFLQ
jgi:hypothetical protein